MDFALASLDTVRERGKFCPPSTIKLTFAVLGVCVGVRLRMHVCDIVLPQASPNPQTLWDFTHIRQSHAK